HRSLHCLSILSALTFFFNATAPTAIYTLSLHDALPICWTRWSGDRSRVATGEPDERRGRAAAPSQGAAPARRRPRPRRAALPRGDRKSTRLNSSHVAISYAVFCLKKKKKNNYIEKSTRS